MPIRNVTNISRETVLGIIYIKYITTIVLIAIDLKSSVKPNINKL